MIAETSKSIAQQKKKPKRKMHANSIANLRPIPWKKGQSGNPKGAPKARVWFWPYVAQFSNMTKAELNKVNTKELTISQIGALKYCQAVANGDFKHIKELIDRELGKAPEHITTEGEQRITVERI